MSKIPTQVVDFSIYNGNEKLLGHGDEITLPNVVSKTASVVLAGGDIDVPGMMTENIELEIPFNVFDDDAGNIISLNKTTMLIIRAAEQKVDGSSHDFEYQGLKVTVKGITKEIELGTLKRGDKMDSKIKMTLTYIKIEGTSQKSSEGANDTESQNNAKTTKTYLELDKLNGTFIVNGEDVRAGISDYL